LTKKKTSTRSKKELQNCRKALGQKILKGWIKKSNIKRLDSKEIKDYDQKKLEIILSLQKRWNLRCSLIKKTSPAVMLSSQDEDTPAEETPSVL
jgi:hypothetical protein